MPKGVVILRLPKEAFPLLPLLWFLLPVGLSCPKGRRPHPLPDFFRWYTGRGTRPVPERRPGTTTFVPDPTFTFRSVEQPHSDALKGNLGCKLCSPRLCSAAGYWQQERQNPGLTMNPDTTDSLMRVRQGNSHKSEASLGYIMKFRLSRQPSGDLVSRREGGKEGGREEGRF